LNLSLSANMVLYSIVDEIRRELDDEISASPINIYGTAGILRRF
jgi:hypothetical protein